MERNLSKGQQEVVSTLTNEEINVVRMYRCIRSRWERNAIVLLLHSLSYGRLNAETTDSYTWNRIERLLGMKNAD